MSVSPDKDRILLIVDLDETLIYATETELDRPPSFQLFNYHVYVRPFAEEFLQDCARWFELAVWSSASDDYVEAVVERIFPDPSVLNFIWGRSRATLRPLSQHGEEPLLYGSDHLHYLKPLKKVARHGWRLERILIIDDTPAKSSRNYGNAIYPSPFLGDPCDNELKLLKKYLRTLKDCTNVRRIEKRNWRSSVQAD